MNKRLFARRIPTVFAAILLLIGIILASYVVRNGFSLFGKASQDTKPQNIRITNITPSSFTLTYTTSEKAISLIKYGTKQPEKLALDDRDQKSQVPKPHNVHSITVTNLTPKTTYLVTIVSNNTTYLDNRKPFSVTTAGGEEEKKEGARGAREGGDTKNEYHISGTALLPQGVPVEEGIMYLSFEGSQLFSTLLDSTGRYKLAVSSILSSSLLNPVTLNAETRLNILITTGKETSTATTLLGQAESVPQITLPNNYDFTFLPEGELIASDSAVLPEFPVFTTQVSEDQEPEITTPEEEETFSDQQPRFRGIALPNQTVEIVIQSEKPIKATVTTDASGNWSYRPETPLTPGSHTITVKTQNPKGFLSILQRRFVVNAAGSQFPDPSVSPSQPSPTPTQQITPTGTPSPTLIPTSTSTPTLTPTPVRTSTTPRPTIAPTGDSSLSLLFTTTAIAAMIVGLTIFVLIP